MRVLIALALILGGCCAKGTQPAPYYEPPPCPTCPVGGCEKEDAAPTPLSFPRPTFHVPPVYPEMRESGGLTEVGEGGGLSPGGFVVVGVCVVALIAFLRWLAS